MAKQATLSKLDHLDEQLDNLVDFLAAHTDTALRHRPAPEAWSALDTLQHLQRAEYFSQQYVRKKLSFNPELRPAGLATFWRSVLLEFYFVSPQKFQAPQEVAKASFDLEKTLKDITDDFRRDRQALRRYLEGLDASLFRKEIYKHPFAGRLSLKGMLRFFEGHMLRHEKQIKRALVHAKAVA